MRLTVGNERAVFHDHGQWLAINHASATSARRLNAPRVISPRGMLSPWARNQGKLKKDLAWRIYARRDLEQAAVIHATSELELTELRDLGVTQPIAVIPNGVDPFPTLGTHTPAPLRPYVLFLSRIHRKKGVAELLQVWQSLGCTDWDLILAGPDSDGMLRRSVLPAGAHYVGMVDGEQKSRLMQQASLFVLPTYSENFGVVVAESLMAGVPVITTHGAPWQRLVTERSGWWIPMNEEALRSGLSIAMKTPAAELRAMGERGREVVSKEFGWGNIAREMAAVYEWLLDWGPRPACVVPR